MPGLVERIAMAQRHVAIGRDVIVRQRNVVAKKRDPGVDASFAQQLLARFEQSQAMFEDDLERLIFAHVINPRGHLPAPILACWKFGRTSAPRLPQPMCHSKSLRNSSTIFPPFA